MPSYVDRALQKFNHPPPLHAQHTPHKWSAPVYGSREPQTATPNSVAQPLDKTCTVRVQSINGTFHYYGRAVDLCIHVALNDVASEQAVPTTDTLDKTHMLMDYLHSYPNVVIRYYT